MRKPLSHEYFNKTNHLFRLIDFVKYDLVGIDREKLAVNSLLEFETKVNFRTGELGKYRHAYYKGLEIKIYEASTTSSNGRITLEGSLHKFWNNGRHNYNDFKFDSILAVLEELEKKFGILPVNCLVKQLEIGVNISPPVPTKKILTCCLLHKTSLMRWMFTKDEGNYIQVQHGNYFIKIYDKQKHYVKKGFDVPNEVLRFEIKYKREKLSRTMKLQKIITLQDVLSYGIENFKPHLLKEWQNILFYDFTTLDETKYKDRYSNPHYWLSLKAENFKYHRNNLNRLIRANPNNLKEKISMLIAEKVDFLNDQTTRIKALNIPLTQLVDKKRKKKLSGRYCIVTGLNIEMQREDSFLLSHEGLKHYYQTDKNVYEEVKRKFLSDIWKAYPVKKQVKEIAHNIRNAINNRRIKQRKLYPEHQILLFDLTEVG